MAQVGTFMGQTFSVSSKRISTPTSLSGEAGADYAAHERAGRKAKVQYLGPKRRSFTVDITFRLQDGPVPIRKREWYIKHAEKGKADYFIIGGRPISRHRLVITDVSEEWDAVQLNGVLTQVSLTLKLEEYV